MFTGGHRVEKQPRQRTRKPWGPRAVRRVRKSSRLGERPGEIAPDRLQPVIFPRERTGSGSIRKLHRPHGSSSGRRHDGPPPGAPGPIESTAPNRSQRPLTSHPIPHRDCGVREPLVPETRIQLLLQPVNSASGERVPGRVETLSRGLWSTATTMWLCRAM